MRLYMYSLIYLFILLIASVSCVDYSIQETLMKAKNYYEGKHISNVPKEYGKPAIYSDKESTFYQYRFRANTFIPVVVRDSDIDTSRYRKHPKYCDVYFYVNDNNVIKEVVFKTTVLKFGGIAQYVFTDYENKYKYKNATHTSCDKLLKKDAMFQGIIASEKKEKKYGKK